MLNIIIILIMGTMVHTLGAMELPRKDKKKRSYLSVPNLRLSDSLSSSKSTDSPNNSPSGSANSSPTASPKHSPTKDNIKISPKRSSKSDLTLPNCQEIFQSQLYSAVMKDDTEKALNLLHPNVDIIDSLSNKTILIVAIKNKNNAIVEALLSQKNIDPNKADKWGNTPLHHAVLKCNEAVIKLLLSDYRVNSILKSTGSSYPHQSTDNEYYNDKAELKNMFSARAMLDQSVNDMVSSPKFLHSDNKYVLDSAVSAVTEMTRNLQLLPYATSEFIKNMILYRTAESIKANSNKQEVCVSNTIKDMVSTW